MQKKSATRFQIPQITPYRTQRRDSTVWSSPFGAELSITFVSDIGGRALGVAIARLYRLSNTSGEKFVTRRTQHDADGLNSLASPQFELEFGLSNEHLESADRVAPGFARFTQEPRVCRIIDEIVGNANAV